MFQLGYRVEEVYFGGAPRDLARFKNRRAEMYWTLRERLEEGAISLADNDELMADLAAIRYFFTAQGKIQLETKDEVRRRLGRSPDRADAVALALAAGAATSGLVGTAKEYVEVLASVARRRLDDEASYPSDFLSHERIPDWLISDYNGRG